MDRAHLKTDVGTLILASFIALVACQAVPAPAQEGAAAKALGDRFKQLDKNGDGKITTAEMPMSAFFKLRDKNGDGAITLDEARAVMDAETPPPPQVTVAEPKPPKAKAGKGGSDLTKTALRQGPRPLKGGDHGVGRLSPDLPFKDLAGKSFHLGGFSKQRAVVIALTSTSCPISKKYLPTLARLAKTYSGRGVTWVLVNPMTTDKPADMQKAAKELSGDVHYVHDREGVLSKALGALTTTDVIVLDAARTVVYHGAIDDQYGFGYSIENPRHKYLADALDAVLANKPPAVAATEAPGCSLDVEERPATESSLTYHGRISRIVQANCVECHREGGVGPFSLDTYEDVVSHAAMIKQVVERGTMPPWFAAPAEATDEEIVASSPWANDRSLAAADKQDLLAWLPGSKPEGDKRDAVQPRTFPAEWQIGKPDEIFEFAKPVAVKATGILPYEHVMVDTKLEEDKWVQAIEVRPGDLSVVHHVLVYLQEGRPAGSPPDDVFDERLGFWGIYVPGNSTLIYPPGFAKRLPKGARLLFQMHYTPNGTATKDRSRIGVIYAKQPPRHEVRVVGLINTRIVIPPGAENHREEALFKLPCDIAVLGFLPHMHVRAKACKYRATRGDKPVTLLDVPRYDFNWQLLYRYYEPQPLSQGDVVKFTVWYDNSPNNPANPDPNQTVRWGKSKSDEMHLGYIEYYVPGQKPSM